MFFAHNELLTPGRGGIVCCGRVGTGDDEPGLELGVTGGFHNGSVGRERSCGFCIFFSINIILCRVYKTVFSKMKLSLGAYQNIFISKEIETKREREKKGTENERF